MSTVGADHTKHAIDRELVINCAGEAATDRALVVLDQQDNGGICGIEVLNPIRVEQAEKDGTFALELTVGTVADDEDLITVEDGIAFERASWDTYPGLEVDYTRDGAMVAIRVDHTDLVSLGS
ncbi:MAG: hypothetical protein J0H98_07180 [Solirubrobacterales bacterium]|nr:hypothetical protein [Solirubrobacterales bacterium]